MYIKALFKKSKRSRVSSGWPFLDLILGMLILFVWLPLSLIGGSIKGRAANELLLSESPITYWFLIIMFAGAGVCCFYGFFKSYRNSLKVIDMETRQANQGDDGSS